MSRKIPSQDDWIALLDTARETSLGLQPGDAVPHGSLASTVRDECDVIQSTASQWIGNAVEKGWLEQRGTGPNREYVATDEDGSLYDADDIDPFLGHEDVEEDDVEAALEAAVDYYHAQLSDDHRWLIEAKWGISRDTIDDLRIGFAPEDNALGEHIEQSDVSAEAALRAGVVRSTPVKHAYECSLPSECSHADWLPDAICELAEARDAGEVAPDDIMLSAVIEAARDAGSMNLYHFWDRRIVFPYYQGVPQTPSRPEYLIARATGKTDDLPGQNKYLKLSVKPWVSTDIVAEPIYGANTVEEDEPLLVVEGITDAIRCHEEDIPCISPVTKGFKSDHLEWLLDLADTASELALCFDSEASGEGLKGALQTANRLLDNEVNVTLADLPRPEGEEKMDPADYLQDHTSADLWAAIDDRINPEDHPEWEELIVPTTSDDYGGDGYDGGENSGDDTSALFNLTIEQVVNGDSRHGVSKGYRGTSPFGHHGNSEEYFVYEDYKGDTRARDHKAHDGYTFTPLTWLVCAAGERSAGSPKGPLTDREIWAAWRYAKEQGILGQTDPIPWKARLHIAREHELAPRDLIRRAGDDPSILPATVHNRILEIVEEEYGLNPGKDSLDTDHKAEKRAEYLAGDGDQDDVGDTDQDDDKGRQVKRMLATLDELDD